MFLVVVWVWVWSEASNQIRFLGFRTFVAGFVCSTYWPETCQLFHFDISFKKNHTKQCLKIFWYGLIQCVLCLVVGLTMIDKNQITAFILLLTAFVTWLLFVFRMCLAKFMSAFSMRFKLQERSHENHGGIIHCFLWLAVQLRPQIRS